MRAPRGRWVHPGALVWLARPGGHCVCARSLGSLACALRVFGFIRGLLVTSRARLSRWAYTGSLVHSGASWGSLGSSSVIGFTGVRPRGRWVHPGLLGYLGLDMGSSRVIEFTRIRLGGR